MGDFNLPGNSSLQQHTQPYSVGLGSVDAIAALVHKDPDLFSCQSILVCISSFLPPLRLELTSAGVDIAGKLRWRKKLNLPGVSILQQTSMLLACTAV